MLSTLPNPKSSIPSSQLVLPSTKTISSPSTEIVFPFRIPVLPPLQTFLQPNLSWFPSNPRLLSKCLAVWRRSFDRQLRPNEWTCPSAPPETLDLTAPPSFLFPPTPLRSAITLTQEPSAALRLSSVLGHLWSHLGHSSVRLCLGLQCRQSHKVISALHLRLGLHSLRLHLCGTSPSSFTVGLFGCN